MTTQVLARKWRPRDFSTLVGQEHVIKALRHALEKQRLHHAYLFTGTRGVGKTTIARILAKSVNCETGITFTPCGQCRACQEIDQGRFVDLLEVDAATNTRVDEMRALLENAMYAPTAGRYKVYVIDEVHMLSNSAFNAMLKTLEEPPPHILFILATTDPQKIPPTVLSRCLQFNLKQMPPEHIVGHLTKVLSAESVQFDAKALQLLAHAAHGSMRDALSLTDQAIAYSAGQVSFEAVEQMLGAVDTRYLFDIFSALAERDGAKLLGLVHTMAERSLPFGSVLQDLASMAYQLSVASVVPSVIEGDPHAETLFALAAKISADELQLIYQIATHARAELQHAPDEAIGFGMALLRMLAFAPNTGPVKSGGQAALSAGRTASGGITRPRGVGGAALDALGVAGIASKPSVVSVVVPDKRPSSASLDSVVSSSVRIPNAASANEPVPSANTVSVLTASSNEAPVFPTASEWPAVAQVLKATGLTRQCLEQSEWVSVTQSNERWAITLRVPIKTYAEAGLVKRVQQLLEQHFACGIDVQVQVGQANHTAFAVESANRIEKQKMAEQAIQTDPFIHELKQQMGAEIIVGSVRPVA